MNNSDNCCSIYVTQIVTAPSEELFFVAFNNSNRLMEDVKEDPDNLSPCYVLDNEMARSLYELLGKHFQLPCSEYMVATASHLTAEEKEYLKKSMADTVSHSSFKNCVVGIAGDKPLTREWMDDFAKEKTDEDEEDDNTWIYNENLQNVKSLLNKSGEKFDFEKFCEKEDVINLIPFLTDSEEIKQETITWLTQGESDAG